MKIIALSDTHSSPLPKEVLDAIKTADMVFHAGDFADVETFQRIKHEKEIAAVYGNMDGVELRQLLPKATVVDCGDGVRIGLFHGEGAPQGLADRVREVFKGEKLSAIVFGHSHAPMNEVVDGVLMFNPGSPTDMIRPPYRSYGVLEVKGGKVSGCIVKLKS